MPKPACIGCPFHSDAARSAMQTDDPESWNDAVGIDWAIRNLAPAKSAISGAAHLHRSHKPLSGVDFGNAAELQAERESLCGIRPRLRHNAINGSLLPSNLPQGAIQSQSEQSHNGRHSRNQQ